MDRGRAPGPQGPPAAMDSFVFAAVLFSAACHAAWNAAAKSRLDPVTTIAMISIASATIALALMLFTGLPDCAAWLWVAASVVIHLFYFIGLGESYRFGDLGEVYPIARGGAPLMTAGGAALLLGENVATAGWAGIVLLVMGVLLLSLRGGADLRRMNPRALGFALFTAFTVSLYSLVDGTGGRIGDSPHPYTLAMFVGNGLVMAAYVVARRGSGAFAAMRPHWKTGALGGALQVVSYGIAIWAMSVAPIALVAALRETSVLFGALLGVLMLRERLNAIRIGAALVIFAGLLLIRLQ
ncbi:MAG: membrane protein [Alphaproteobacteria bacterium]|nr:MAG: membrane protein [Alphaproteobacteria bacterium]